MLINAIPQKNKMYFLLLLTKVERILDYVHLHHLPSYFIETINGSLTTGLHKFKIFNDISLTVEFEFCQRIFVVDLHHDASGRCAGAPQCHFFSSALIHMMVDYLTLLQPMVKTNFHLSKNTGVVKIINRSQK